MNTTPIYDTLMLEIRRREPAQPDKEAEETPVTSTDDPQIRRPEVEQPSE